MMLFHEVLFLVVAFLSVMAYAAIKTKGIELLRADADNAKAAAALHEYALNSWILMAYAVGHTTFVKIALEVRSQDD